MSKPLYIAGLDLSGPSNLADTHLSIWSVGAAGLVLHESLSGLDDAQISAIVERYATAAETVVGIDAPLSYSQRGGDRPGDADLRRHIRAVGMRSGSVMPPTMMRMVYLTLRGVSVARMLGGLDPPWPIRLVEVHPGAALGLRGAPLAAVLAFKREPAARAALIEWLRQQGLDGAVPAAPSDHEVASWAAALAAWSWRRGDSAWLHPAAPPWHPFDFAC
jgi:predicted nuclease with RNAse H fold